MSRFLFFILLFIFFACKTPPLPPSILPLTSFVNPFIGTGGHGHTYPGATLPFGMMQLSPDTRLTGWDGCSGYHYTDSIIYGFSHTHLSGTGVSDYGDLLLMPHSDEQAANLDYTLFHSKFDKKNEQAEAGYYQVILKDDNIKVALSTTSRCGMHQYIFDEAAPQNLMLDLQHRDPLIESSLEVIDNKTIRGMRRSKAWAEDQHFYFYLQFSKPFTKKTILNNAKGQAVHAQFSFDNKAQELLVKVGISAVSMEGAQKNLDAEIPHWAFHKIKNDAQGIWEEELQKVVIEGGTSQQKTIFYTALYHSFLAPNLFMDIDGRYRGRDNAIHQSTDFTNYSVFSLWDTFRATHPLYTILQRKRTLDFIKTFLVQYQQGGLLPVWELAANETGCMIGYHSVSVIADAYAKGIRDFDLNLALEAMNHSATQAHLGLDYYQKNGFIACDEEAESVSKTLEYAYDDWCIAQFAKGINNDSLYQIYNKRAQSYKNIYDPNTQFLRGRINGGWSNPFSPSEVNFNYTEANAWQYTFFAPQDIDGLINLMGSPAAFEAMLDRLFAAESTLEGRQQVDITGLIGQYAHGNEPSHHVAYLYNYVNKSWKTQERIHEIMNNLYQNSPSGLSGNEDCGQMSSWYNLSAMGFYPVTPGADFYLFGTPSFDKMTLNLENGKTFVIEAKGLSQEHFYIKSIQLNGQDYTNNYLKHEAILNGGTLVFEMTNRPNKNSLNLPANLIEEGLIVPTPFLESTGKTFVKEMAIKMGVACSDCTLYYSIDGSIPDSESLIYEDSIIISQTTLFKLIAIDSKEQQSNIMEQEFIQIDDSRNITINTKYAAEYAAGGDRALIDHLRGGTNFRTGTWQGYQDNLEVVVDLGATKSFSKIEIGFLQDIQSWIFYPPSVEYYSSSDGKNFVLLGTTICDFPDNSYGAFIKNFDYISTKKTNARYLKIIANNYGICPSWHLGSGGATWLFADEITIF